MDPDTLAAERIRSLAESLDCFTEDDLQLLAGITASTAHAWRKRGTGPAYILFGNCYLYPRPALREFLAGQVREPRGVPAKGVL